MRICEETIGVTVEEKGESANVLLLDPCRFWVENDDCLNVHELNECRN